MACVMAAAAPAVAAADCSGADADPGATPLSSIAASTLCLINEERVDRGLSALRTNAKLAKAAEGHVRDMVDHQYFAHDSLDGRRFSTRIKQAGYVPAGARWFVGENLAWGTGAYGTPRGVVTAWMGSPGHRANILEAGFKEIGLGIVTGNPRDRSGAGGTYATEFGTVTAPSTKKRVTRRIKVTRRG